MPPIFNSIGSPGNITPQEPPQLDHESASSQNRCWHILWPLTSSTTEHESHDREYGLQLSSSNYPHDRHDDYSDGNQYSYDCKLLGPQPLLEFKPDWLSTFTGFELCKPVDPFVGGVYVVGVDESMHEGMISGVVFCGFGVGNVVGRVLREEEKSALTYSSGLTRVVLMMN